MNTLQTYSYRDIWRIAYPILAGMAMEHVIGMTDTAFLGRLPGQAGEVALGASALGSVFYLAVFVLGLGFTIGCQILIGRRNGQQAYRDIGPIVSQGIVAVVGLAIATIALSLLFAPALLQSMVRSGAVYHATADYLNWRILGLLFAFPAFLFRAFYTGITHTRILTLNAVVMVGSNALLNYALVFGKFGFPALGIEGAAIASVVAEGVSLLFFAVYTRYKADRKKYALFTRWRPDRKLLGQILKVSTWTMLQPFVSVATWFLFFIAVEGLGEQPLAVSNLVRSLSALPFVVIGSFGSALCALVSNLMGAGKSSQVAVVCRRTLLLCLLTVLPVLLVFGIFPRVVLSIFTSHGELIEASVSSLLVLIADYLMAIPAILLFNVVSGSGNTRSAMLLELGALAGYIVYVYFVAVRWRADIAVCWTAEMVYMLILMGLSWLYLRKADWQSKKI